MGAEHAERSYLYPRIPSILRCLMAEITTVKVTKKTREKLVELGKKNETYEEIIDRLIEFYKSNSRKRLT